MTATSTPGERARALYAVLKNKDLIPEGYIEQLTQLMEHGWSPDNGARIVAKAWVDPAFRELLLKGGKFCTVTPFQTPSFCWQTRCVH